ncbi:HAD family hydrolase [Streptomyces sp. NPDC004752]
MSDSPIETAVFDLAGTTVREDGLVETAVRSVTGDHFDAALFARSRGGSKRDMLVGMLGEDRADAALERFDDALIAGVRADRVTAMPRVEEHFAALRDAGIQVVLITGFSATVQSALLTHLGWNNVIDAALTPDARLRGRPHPDLVLEAALRTHASSMSAIAVVGDTVNDVLAARRAGAGIRAAVTTGAHDAARLATAHPTHLLADVGEFTRLLTTIPHQ